MTRNQKIIIAGVLLIMILVFVFNEEIGVLFKDDKFDWENQTGFDTDPVNMNIYGCLDPTAENYNPIANVQGEREEGCIYTWGCCDKNATNYDASADSCWALGNTELLCDYGAGYGVTTPPAENFWALAPENFTWTNPDTGVTNTYDTQNPNDCTCANLNPFVALNCLSKNQLGEVIYPPVCIGEYPSAQYCNSNDYTADGVDSGCGLFGCTCSASVPNS